MLDLGGFPVRIMRIDQKARAVLWVTQNIVRVRHPLEADLAFALQELEKVLGPLVDWNSVIKQERSPCFDLCIRVAMSWHCVERQFAGNLNGWTKVNAQTSNRLEASNRY